MNNLNFNIIALKFSFILNLILNYINYLYIYDNFNIFNI